MFTIYHKVKLKANNKHTNLCLYVYVWMCVYVCLKKDTLKCWVVIFFFLLIYIFLKMSTMDIYFNEKENAKKY